jgi:hypothetical protein
MNKASAINRAVGLLQGDGRNPDDVLSSAAATLSLQAADELHRTAPGRCCTATGGGDPRSAAAALWVTGPGVPYQRRRLAEGD